MALLPSLASGAAQFDALVYEFSAGDGFQILVVELLAIGLGDIERIEDLEREPRIHRAAFRIERAVGSEHALLQREELQAAFGRRLAAEHRGVGVEVLFEIVERAFLEALAKRDVIFVTGARAQYVPTRPNATLEHRHDTAE